MMKLQKSNLVSIQWCIFTRKAIYEVETSLDDWSKDFPKDSLFAKRLETFRNQFDLTCDSNMNLEDWWDYSSATSSSGDW